MSFRYSFHRLGWHTGFASQLTEEDFEARVPARVTCVQRGVFTALTERGDVCVDAPHDASIAVGDWVLIDALTRRFDRVLEAESRLVRMAAGTPMRAQVVAANLDTVFVVTSCNHDFNLSRLERYLALAREGRIEPVIVLTKIDMNDPGPFIEQATSIAPNVQILAVNALDPTHSAALLPWLAFGRTAAFVGSSGVGKSTLVNLLTNVELETNGIREHDSKGRHTTTSRHMFEVVSGGWVIDTPGMRELNVGAAETGISATFDDIEAIARACRFRDCTHAGDAGCAVSGAIELGQLTQRRFDNYLKLRRESQRATQSIRERRETDRQFGRMAKAVLKRRKWERGDA